MLQFSKTFCDGKLYPPIDPAGSLGLWGFEETPQKMTEIGKTLFINVVIWTANKAWESDI